MAVTESSSNFMSMLAEIWAGLGGSANALDRVTQSGEGSLPSVFAVTDLAVASVAVAGLAVSELIAAHGVGAPPVLVDRRLASLWFAASLRPEGWSLPPIWDAIAGDYRAAEGWIRLHTNAPHHRAAALRVLGVDGDKPQVAHAVSRWSAQSLEDAVVAEGGCAAAMRSIEAWADHPQGKSVAMEPLIQMTGGAVTLPRDRRFDPERPLAGLKVLDLTRVIAGPVATRFLAGYGAEVLRIDPPGWDEPAIVPELMIGKRTAHLDLKTDAGRDLLLDLLRQSDVLVHGYRADALERLGLGVETRRAVAPGLIDVSLDAYGWTGPWRERRGFDSLVQMSSGIADAGMRLWGKDKPTPLPVQALDHATGYLMAAAAIRGIVRRLESNVGSRMRASLAATGHFLIDYPQAPDSEVLRPESQADLGDYIEQTAWGSARRVLPPVEIRGTPMRWGVPASPIGSHSPRWN
jgi:crotonobetainyl-CoA:carnitine CoA-transferase CaiB-like acyl-CoA transferase